MVFVLNARNKIKYQNQVPDLFNYKSDILKPWSYNKERLILKRKTEKLKKKSK